METSKTSSSSSTKSAEPDFKSVSEKSITKEEDQREHDEPEDRLLKLEMPPVTEEDQINWMTSEEEPKDPRYWKEMVESRIKDLQEAKAENEQLESQIKILEAEQESHIQTLRRMADQGLINPEDIGG